MTREQKNTLAEVLSFRCNIQVNQAYRAIEYAYETDHAYGMYEVMQTLTDLIYILTGKYDVGAHELLELFN